MARIHKIRRGKRWLGKKLEVATIARNLVISRRTASPGKENKMRDLVEEPDLAQILNISDHGTERSWIMDSCFSFHIS